MTSSLAVKVLETALNRKGAKYSVKLSNVGNPDYHQDPDKPLFDTTCGWAHVNTLKECVQLCMTYIAFYDLGGGNWDGGEIECNGAFIGRVAYNGRIFDSLRWTPQSKEIIP